METKLKFTTERNKQLEKTNYEKEQFLKNIFKFIQLYDKKFSDVLNSLPVKNKEDFISNNTNLSILIDLLKKKVEWGVNECKNLK
jgi:hypothetical protein